VCVTDNVAETVTLSELDLVPEVEMVVVPDTEEVAERD
jgi:hypothetical protein